MLLPGSLFRKGASSGGCYIYFLSCRGEEDNVVYIKIGLSEFPLERMKALVNGCPLEPLTFGTVHVYSRDLAKKIERALHLLFKTWRTRGEWFKFALEDKHKFNHLRGLLFEKYRSSAWPMNTVLIDIDPYLDMQRRRMYGLIRARRMRGRAYADFERHQYS